MLGERINTLRTSFGWSQVELGKRVNASKQAVSNWENENIVPSIDMLIRLSNVFGVTTDYLLGLEDVPRLSIEGLSSDMVAHLELLIKDLQK